MAVSKIRGPPGPPVRMIRGPPGPPVRIVKEDITEGSF